MNITLDKKLNDNEINIDVVTFLNTIAGKLVDNTLDYNIVITDEIDNSNSMEDEQDIGGGMLIKSKPIDDTVEIKPTLNFNVAYTDDEGDKCSDDFIIEIGNRIVTLKRNNGRTLFLSINEKKNLLSLLETKLNFNSSNSFIKSLSEQISN